MRRAAGEGRRVDRDVRASGAEAVRLDRDSPFTLELTCRHDGRELAPPRLEIPSARNTAARGRALSARGRRNDARRDVRTRGGTASRCVQWTRAATPGTKRRASQRARNASIRRPSASSTATARPARPLAQLEGTRSTRPRDRRRSSTAARASRGQRLRSATRRSPRQISAVVPDHAERSARAASRRPIASSRRLRASRCGRRLRPPRAAASACEGGLASPARPPRRPGARDLRRSHAARPRSSSATRARRDRARPPPAPPARRARRVEARIMRLRRLVAPRTAPRRSDPTPRRSDRGDRARRADGPPSAPSRTRSRVRRTPHEACASGLPNAPAPSRNSGACARQTSERRRV